MEESCICSKYGAWGSCVDENRWGRRVAGLVEVSSDFSIDWIPFLLEQRSTLSEKGFVNLLLKKNILSSCSDIPDYISHRGLYRGLEGSQGEITLE